MRARIPTVAAGVFCGLLAVTAYAQTAPVSAPPPPPANLAFADGSVDVVHDGVVERADPPALLVDGDVVRTAEGRAEVVFADGTLLHLDRGGDLEMLAPDRLRLVSGRAIVRVSPAATRAYTIDTPAASVRLDGRGEYTISAANGAGNDLELSVARGSAEIDDGSQRVVVRAGESVSLAASGSRAIFRTFNSARWDGFAQWSNERANGFSGARSSAQLPVELRAYGPEFDQYGRWDSVAPYGAVWIPAVSAGWRPYSDGSWGYTRYGWTWNGRDRWAWPTHHYGRWGYNGASWFWIPTNVWGPAWVSWGFSSGYVSWSPLGFDGQPAIGFWPRRDHPAYQPYSPWRGWTIVPRDQFGPRRPVRSFAIDGNRLDEPTRRAMVFANGGPPRPGGAFRADTRSTGGSGVRPYAPIPRAVPRPAAAPDAPAYDRSGPIRRPRGSVAPAPVDSAVPRDRVPAAPRAEGPPPVQYIGGSARRNERPRDESTATTDPNDTRTRRPFTESPAERERRIVTRPESSDTRDQDRDRGNRPAYRGGYERPAASGNERTGDGERGGSVRSGGSARPPAEAGSGARERGGSRQGGGPSAGAPSPGGRGAGSGADRGGRGSGGGKGGGGGAVRRPR